MLPTQVQCENCGRTATVRGYGRVEYDWPDVTTADLEATTPTILSARLTIDCPSCGVTSQNFFPAGVRRTAIPSEASRILTRRGGTPHQRTIRPNRPR